MLILEGEEEGEVATGPLRSGCLTVWADAGTGGGSGSGSTSTSAASSAQSSLRPSSSDEVAESVVLKLNVLSPVRQGRTAVDLTPSWVRQAWPAKLNLGIDKTTMRLYRKEACPTFRKVAKRQ